MKATGSWPMPWKRRWKRLIRDGSVNAIYGHYGLRYDVPEMYQQ